MIRLKTILKWAALVALVVAVTPWLNDLSVETRLIGGFIMLLLLINYNDGKMKDRVQRLEMTVDDLSRKLDGRRP